MLSQSCVSIYCDAACTFSHFSVIAPSYTYVLHCPLVLATSSSHRRNNGANCFASVQRKLVLTGARAMIHTEDLRDARVRVGRAGFTLPTSPDEKSNSPTSRNLRLNPFCFQIPTTLANNFGRDSAWVHPAGKYSTNTNTAMDGHQRKFAGDAEDAAQHFSNLFQLHLYQVHSKHQSCQSFCPG